MQRLGACPSSSETFSSHVLLTFFHFSHSFNTEDGEPLDSKRTVSVPGDRGSNTHVSGIKWHPQKSVLAVSYSDGCLKLWSPKSIRCAENAMTHAGRTICSMDWSTDGLMLCTGDATGTVAMWTIDTKNRPTLVTEVPVLSFLEGKKDVKVANVLPTPFSFLKPNDRGKVTSFLVLYQHEGGSVMRCIGVDTDQHGKPTSKSAVLFETDSDVVSTLVKEDGETNADDDKSKTSVVTVAVDGSLTKRSPKDGSAIDFDENTRKMNSSTQWQEVLHFKLPVEGSYSGENVVWAEKNILAVVSENDPSCSVRMFDLNDGSNYFLRPFSKLEDDTADATKTGNLHPGRERVPSMRLTCVTRDWVTGALACGSKNGTVTVFKPSSGEVDKKTKSTSNNTSKENMSPNGSFQKRGRRADVSPVSPSMKEKPEGTAEGVKPADTNNRDALLTDSDTDDDEGGIKKKDPESLWRLAATTETDVSIAALRFAPGMGSRVLVALVDTDRNSTLHAKQKMDLQKMDISNESSKKESDTRIKNYQSTLLLSKVKLADKIREHVSLAQIASDTVLVESTYGQFDPRAFRSSLGQILGADCTEQALLIWTSKHIETHVFGQDGYEKRGRFPHHVSSGGGVGAISHDTSTSKKSPIGSQTCALSGSVVFRPGRSAGVVEACELNGATRDSLLYDKEHGAVTNLDVNGEFLVCCTTGGWVHVWWLGGRSPTVHGVPAGTRVSMTDTRIESVRVNGDGSKVLVSLVNSSDGLCGSVSVYDVECDSWSVCDIYKRTGRLAENIGWDCGSSSLFVVQTGRAEGSGGDAAVGEGQSNIISSRFKDDANAHGVVAFTCFAVANANGNSNGQRQTTNIVLQESHVLPDGFDAVLGITAPHLFVSQKNNFFVERFGGQVNGACFSIPMRDFDGIDLIQESEGRKEILNSLLGFHEALAVTSGGVGDGEGPDTETKDANSSLVFRAVKNLSHSVAWECASRMCVRTKRLDIAEMCLANMGHVRGARAARDASRIKEPDARVAAVAVHLGLVEDAERLYFNCGRFDLLVELYRASGRWKEALAVAQKHDRVHLKSTHYAYGHHLESLGDVTGAIKQFEKAGRAFVEIPRLLSHMDEFAFLESYVAESGDLRLRLWRAKYMESVGDTEKALEEYLACESWIDATRVYVSFGDLENAASCVMNAGERANEDSLGNPEGKPPGNPNANPNGNPTPPSFQALTLTQTHAASAFHLARAYEARDLIRDAIFWFSKAGRFGHATRLAMAHNLDSEVYDLALKAPATVSVQVARFFLKRDDPEKAVHLFHKAGKTKTAASVCFKHDLFEPLSEIVDGLLRIDIDRVNRSEGDDLTDEVDPESSTPDSKQLLKKCASWFTEKGRFDVAVLLEVRSGNFQQALRVAIENDVPMTESLSESLTQELDREGNNISAIEKKSHTLDLAKLSKRQGQYHLACKLYAKAGERSKAMRCLLKTGDPEKVIFFANVSRDRDAYIMAGNFLQTLDFKRNEASDDTGDGTHADSKKSYTSNVINFYTKAKAFAHLAGFHESNAEREIDEFRDYDKALVGLKQALNARQKESAKAEDGDASATNRVHALEQAIGHVSKFCELRVSLTKDSKKTTKAIVALADEVEQADSQRKKSAGSYSTPAPPSVRVGDLFAMLVEHAYGVQKDAESAIGYLLKMNERGVNISQCVDDVLLQDIERDAGRQVPRD